MQILYHLSYQRSPEELIVTKKMLAKKKKKYMKAILMEKAQCLKC